MMDMIRVVITGQATNGRFPYRIDTVGTRLAAPANGLSSRPLIDACRHLKRIGAASDDALIGLYNRGTGQWRERTSVGYGARIVSKAPAEAPGALEVQEAREIAPEEKNAPSAPAAPQETPIAEKPTKSSAPPPAPHKPPESPAGKDQAAAKPAKPKHSPHKLKPKGSSARPGRR